MPRKCTLSRHRRRRRCGSRTAACRSSLMWKRKLSRRGRRTTTRNVNFRERGGEGGMPEYLYVDVYAEDENSTERKSDGTYFNISGKYKLSSKYYNDKPCWSLNNILYYSSNIENEILQFRDICIFFQKRRWCIGFFEKKKDGVLSDFPKDVYFFTKQLRFFRDSRGPWNFSIWFDKNNSSYDIKISNNTESMPHYREVKNRWEAEWERLSKKELEAAEKERQRKAQLEAAAAERERLMQEQAAAEKLEKQQMHRLAWEKERLMQKQLMQERQMQLWRDQQRDQQPSQQPVDYNPAAAEENKLLQRLQRK